MDTTSSCILCDEIMDDVENVKTLGPKQLNTFIIKSHARQDDYWQSWEKGNRITVHESCRKTYSARPARPQTKRRRTESPKADISTPQLESIESTDPPDHTEFILKNNCVFCGKRTYRFREDVRTIKDPLLKSRLLSMAAASDELMMKRLQGNPCLVQIGASYHKSCYNKLFSSNYTPQPADDTVNEEAFQKVKNHLEAGTKIIYPVKELRGIMGENTMSNRILFKRLKVLYGDEIFFDIQQGKEPNVLFRHLEIQKVCSDWFSSDGTVTKERRWIVIRTAAEMLHEEILEANFQTSSYSPATKFSESVSTEIPKNVQDFFGHLLHMNDPHRENKHRCFRDFLSHAVTTAIRPRSFISNLQLIIGSYILRKTGSKLVINLLSKIGVCASWYQIKRFRQNTIMDPSKMIVDENSFVQYVFDNTDHNVSSLDGKEA